MRIIYRKVSIFILAFSFIIALFPIQIIAATAHYNEVGWEITTAQYNAIKSDLPKLPDGSVSPMLIKGATPINYHIWMDKHLLVYGNHNKVQDNNFKLGTQIVANNVVPNDGYYYGTDDSGTSGRGEYRYHGLDVNGNPFSNINFINDANTLGAKNWVKWPWANLPLLKKPTVSKYNDAAEGNVPIADLVKAQFIATKTQEWINKSLPGNQVKLKGKAPDPQVYEYMNILSAPTCVYPGQGRMWHVVDNGSIWYQSFSVPKLSQTDPGTVVEAVCQNPPSDFEIIDDAKLDNTIVRLKYKVMATLQDAQYKSDDVMKSVYYTTQDLKSWDFRFRPDGGTEQIKTGVAKSGNNGVTEFEYKVTYSYLRSHGWQDHIIAYAKPLFKNGIYGGEAHNEENSNFDLIPVPQPDPDQPPFDIKSIINFFSPDVSIPESAFENINFPASDNSDMTHVTGRRVYVDNILVDDSVFFSGSYRFGAVSNNGKLCCVRVEYDLDDTVPVPEGEQPSVTKYVYVYPTKPVAAFKLNGGSWKENRKMSAQETCTSVNIPIVLQNYPITQYRWTWGGDTTQLRIGTDTDTLKEMLYKKPGIYTLTMECCNTLGRWSDPYTVQFEVLQDVAPAIELNLNECVTSRVKPINAWNYSVCSTDGDTIQAASIELWYDSDNNGTVDTKLQTWDGKGQFPSYTANKLGYYKYVVTAKDEFGQEKISAFITDSDRKTARYEVEFWIDNLQPMSDIYINVPIQRPSIDTFIMLDKNLSDANRAYVQNNNMNITNWLIGQNIIPNVNQWDMKTYTYSQAASSSCNSGSSYPPDSLYYSSNGYSGTLSRSSVSDNGYNVDYGSDSTVTESKYVDGVTCSGWGETYYEYTRWGWTVTGSACSDQPDTSYSDSEGYSGSLSQYSFTQDSDSGGPSGRSYIGDTYTQTRTYTGYYGGTVYRTRTVHNYNWQWVSDYTGYYSGTIYKNVRQPYTNPFNATSDKFVIYVSDGTISELSDLQIVKSKAAFKLILIGQPGIASQIANDYFIDNTGRTIDQTINSALSYIAQASPAVEKIVMLQNESFTLNVGQIDLENDPVITQEMQYVHTASYFDNPTGQEPGTVTAYSDASGWTGAIRGNFANVGKYEIYRRVKDRPSADTNFSGYSYYSSPTRLEVYVHRKPLASCTLDWVFDTVSGVYKTTWVDKSYDLDHQYSRSDKGIVDRKIMYRPQGGTWIYAIPDNLVPGTTYELQYYVKDPEGVWSDPFGMTFTASNIPAIQVQASLRALDNHFSTASIPASEQLEFYNIWTRYPYDVRLELGKLIGGSIETAARKTVSYSAATGVKNGQDITWNNIPYQIPATLPDGSYTYRIEGIATNGQKGFKDFPVTVLTPVNLVPSMPAQLVAGTICSDITAVTSRYASSLQLTLFSGTAYQTVFNMSPSAAGYSKYWSVSCSIPSNIPEGNYTAVFRAATPNGNVETKSVTYRVETLKITNVTVEGCWNHWRGQTDMFGKVLSNEPHRFLSLETIKINIYVQGRADKVIIRFSPELEAMKYTNSKGRTYDYRDDFFGRYVLFPQDSTILISNPQDSNHVYWEYALPLAPNTKSWDNVRERPPYSMTVTAFKGTQQAVYTLNDLELTGSIYDLTYIQPVN